MITRIRFPVTFSIGLPSIQLHFTKTIDTDDSLFGKSIRVELRESKQIAQEWTFYHILQPTFNLDLTGIDFGNYTLTLSSVDGDPIPMPYTVTAQLKMIAEHNEISGEEIAVSMVSKENQVSGQQGGRNAFGGALMTSGSFTMMAAGNGFD